MLISIAIQHHPSRAAHAAALFASVPGAEIVEDPEPDGKPSAIRTYIECLRRTPGGVSHRLVLQDDTRVCRNFRSRAHHAIRERPGDIIAFFVPNFALHGRVMREARKEGREWTALPRSANWGPAVATCWPVEMAADFVEFADAYVARRRAQGKGTIGDDPVIGSFRRARDLTIWATVPSLVQHDDVAYSLVKRREYKGLNPARRAAVFDE